MLDYLRAIAHDTRGATAVEYGLIVSLVIIAMLTALTTFASKSVGMWGMIANRVVNG